MQGASINEKHIEVIIKQMFSRYKVIDSGDADLNAGGGRKRPKGFGRGMKKAESGGKNPAKLEPTVMPIAKVALSAPDFCPPRLFRTRPEF